MVTDNRGQDLVQGNHTRLDQLSHGRRSRLPTATPWPPFNAHAFDHSIPHRPVGQLRRAGAGLLTP